MSDAPDSATVGSDSADAMNIKGDSPVSSELKISRSTILMEVTDDIVILFSKIPEGIGLLDLGLIPEHNQAQLPKALGSVGNAGTVVGSIVEAITSAQGFFRLNEVTFLLLRNGGRLAARDDAKLRTILKNGEIIAQTRFIPVPVTAATTLAAIGPVIAVIALQVQLDGISSLVRTNITFTAQALKTIRSKQWSELEDLAGSVSDTSQRVCEIGTLTDTLWRSVAPMGQPARKQTRLYRRNITGHAQKIRKSDGHVRRQYPEFNAEVIVLETYTLLTSLKMHATYQALMAARTRKRSGTDGNEAKLFEITTHDTSPEIEDSCEEIGQLTESLVRELWTIAGLPGRTTMPLTKKHRDAKAAKLTCAQPLEAIEPLARSFHPAVTMPAVPEVAYAPDDLGLDPYLRVPRWFLEDGEQPHDIIFPYETGANNLPGELPATTLSKLLDATQDIPRPDKIQALTPKATPSTLVVVTGCRIVIMNPRELLHCGGPSATYPLDDAEGVRPRTGDTDHMCPAIGIATKRGDIRWMFPARTDQTSIDDLVTMIDDLVATITESIPSHAETRTAIASSATGTASS